MSARLPIARALLEGAPCRWAKFQPGDSGEDDDAVLQRQMRESLTNSVAFDIQVASDIYLAARDKDYRLESSFGAMRLPYPDVWMEWRLEHDAGHIEMASIVLERSAEESLEDVPPGQVQLRLGIAMRVPDVGNAINMLRASPTFRVDKLGRYIPGSRQTTLVLDGNAGPIEDRASIARLGAEEAIVTSLLAVNLTNCKNVKVEETGRVNFRRSGSDKRRGVPAKTLRYHTIILPGGGSQAEGSGASLTHRAAAIHRVRGHFKTFTEVAPLMGRHVGTYWWGWQVRGNKDNGMVVSDYKVGENV